MKNNNKRSFAAGITALLLLIMFAAGCSVAVTVTQQKGLDLYRAGKFDEAVTYYEKAIRLDPKEQELRTMLFKCKLNSYYAHLAAARRLKEEQKKDEAIKEYQTVLAIFPNNTRIKDEMDALLNGEKIVKPAFKSYIKVPVTLKADPRERISLKLNNTPITRIFKMLGKPFGINFIFDKDFRDFVHSVEIESVGFYEILNQLCMVGSARYRVMDTKSVLIYPDTTFKNRTFGLKGVKVYYLSNTKAEEAKKLIMTVFRDEQILVQEDTNLNSLIIKADYNSLVEIERFIASVDKERNEVEIDVEILELNRSLINSIGADYGKTLSGISIGNVGADGKINNVFNVNDLGKSSFFMSLPSAVLHFLENDDNTKIISKPNLRGLENEEIHFVVGDDIPIPQTQFQAGAAGGFNNIPVTSYQYQNVGVDVKITPTIHRNGEITMKVKLKMDYITGYRGDFPTLGKREMESVIRLKEGETSIIGGFIKDEIRGSMAGLPGVSRLPIIGTLFAKSSMAANQTDLIFSITPRVVRRVIISDEDQNAIWSDDSLNQMAFTEEPQETPSHEMEESAPGSAISISPNNRRVPAGAVTYFTIRMNAVQPVGSLSISGSLSGGNAVIEELKTDFFGGDDVKILKNSTAGSFDIGYTFEPKPIKSCVLGQLKVKFNEKGNYTLSIPSISAYTKERQQIQLTSADATIEVYQIEASREPERSREDVGREGREREEESEEGRQ